MYPVDIRQLKTFTLPRMINAAKVYSSYLYSRLIRKAVVVGYPVVLSIEPTSYCNLKCPQCPTGMGTLKRDTGYMDFELYNSILNELAEYTTTIMFYFQGEPFLNKQLPEMIDKAKRRNIYTITSTNGHFLEDKNVDSIIGSGLDAIIVSLDGITPETYSSYRINGDLEKVVEGIKRLAGEKKRVSKKYPRIYLQFLILKGNEDQIPGIKKLGRELGVDKVMIKTAQIYSDTESQDLLPDRPDYSRYREVDGEHVLKYEIPDRCKRIWTTAVITWDGIVASCCFDKDADHSFGIWDGRPFLDIWKSEKAMKFRQQILNNRKAVEICRNCTEGLKEFK